MKTSIWLDVEDADGERPEVGHKATLILEELPRRRGLSRPENHLVDIEAIVIKVGANRPPSGRSGWRFKALYEFDAPKARVKYC